MHIRELARAESMLRGGLDAGPSAQKLRQLALLRLAWGKPIDAVQILEQARRLEPDNPRILNDLACAHLTQARQKQEPYALVRALAVIAEAVEIAPLLPEIRFTRAVALELLFLNETAHDAWGEYLEIDKESEWAREARQRRKRLATVTQDRAWSQALLELQTAGSSRGGHSVAAVVARFPEKCLLYVQKRLLPKWAQLTQQGRSSEADRTLHEAAQLGAELARISGDWMIADSVSVIAESRARKEAGRREHLMVGHLDLAQGLSLKERDLFAQARAHFENALKTLAAARSPLSKWARYQVIICDYQERRHRRALPLFMQLRNQTDSEKYPLLAARLHRAMGLIQRILGNLGAALSHYQQSLSLFEKSGDSLNQAALSTLLSEIFDYLGNPQEAWKHRYLAMSKAVDHPDDSATRHMFQGAALAELENGSSRSALEFQNEAYRLAAKNGDARSVANVLSWRVTIRARLGQREAAFQDLRQARQLIEDFRDLNLKKILYTDSLVAEAELRQDWDPPQRTLGLLDQAAGLYREMDLEAHVGRLHFPRAEVYLRQGLRGKAEHELRMGIEWIDSLRESVAQPRFRGLYLDRVRPVFDLMIRLQGLDRGDDKLALDYSERSRARVLLDRLGTAPPATVSSFPQPMTSQEVLEKLPRGVALIEYTVLSDHLLVWWLFDSDLHFRAIPIDESELRSQVSDFLAAIRRREEPQELDPLGERLYSILVSGVRPILKKATQAVFVPDKFLHALPFGALRRKGADHFLVEELAILTAPSATSYIVASKRDRQLASSNPPSLSAFGNPAISRSLFPQLPPLAGAEGEVRQIAGLYEASEIHLGASATKKQLLAMLGGSTFLHFAGHALANDRHPLESALLMSPASDTDSGLLSARELLALRGDRQTRMVVLSACRTAGGSPLGGEAAMPLVQALLGAGIPIVVATLWEVNDEASRRLMYQFHKHLVSGLDAASALRLAQISSLEDPRFSHPLDWASFRVHGG
ncbi:MAG TPA: CHAT domain-containing tetratricopeptide repeat protein [Acidobacteriota bacterium]|nr:CHAT domain-containing tetratricopeptide repeat protein [Acidobacteriota bacterium]